MRLRDYDYSQNGAYFITICTLNRECKFGQIENSEISLSEYGLIAQQNLISIAKHFSDVQVDKFIVMPNHVHLILTVESENVGTRYIVSGEPDQRTPYIVSDEPNQRTPYMASLQAKSKQTVSKSIQQYKASVSRKTGITRLWQPRFHDHIIRNEEEYLKVWQYIDTNAQKWETDRYCKR